MDATLENSTWGIFDCRFQWSIPFRMVVQVLLAVAASCRLIPEVSLLLGSECEIGGHRRRTCFCTSMLLNVVPQPGTSCITTRSLQYEEIKNQSGLFLIKIIFPSEGRRCGRQIKQHFHLSERTCGTSLRVRRHLPTLRYFCQFI